MLITTRGPVHSQDATSSSSLRARVALRASMRMAGSAGVSSDICNPRRRNHGNYILIIPVIRIIAKNNPCELNELVELMQLEGFREMAIVTIPSGARGSRHAREGPARWRRMRQPAPPKLYDRREGRVTLDE